MELRESRHRTVDIVKDMIAIPHEDSKKAACGRAGSEDHCHCRHVEFLISSRAGNDSPIQRINNSEDTISGSFGDQTIFDNGLKTIR